MKNYIYSCLLVISVLLIFSLNVFAYGLSPMSLSIEPAGKNAVGSFYLENKTDDPVPVEMSVTKRLLDSDGNEETPALTNEEKKDFTIYPPMLTIGPHETRTVKVRYKGRSDFKIEQTYRLYVRQLPLNNYQKDKNKNVLKILTRYGASLYISSPDFNPDIVIAEAKYVEVLDSKQIKKPMIDVVLQNNGRAHINMINYNVKFSDTNGNSVTLPWSDVSKQFGLVNVFAEHKRHVLIPWVDSLTKGKLKGEIKFIE